MARLPTNPPPDQPVEPRPGQACSNWSGVTPATAGAQHPPCHLGLRGNSILQSCGGQGAPCSSNTSYPGHGTSEEQTQPTSAEVTEAPPTVVEEAQRPDTSAAGAGSCSGSGPAGALTHTPALSLPTASGDRTIRPRPRPKRGPWGLVGRSAAEGSEQGARAAPTKRAGRGRRKAPATLHTDRGSNPAEARRRARGRPAAGAGRTGRGKGERGEDAGRLPRVQRLGGPPRPRKPSLRAGRAPAPSGSGDLRRTPQAASWESRPHPRRAAAPGTPPSLRPGCPARTPARAATPGPPPLTQKSRLKANMRYLTPWRQPRAMLQRFSSRRKMKERSR